MKTIAVIGCGRIANNMHLRAFSEMQDLVKVKYACDILEEKAVALKEKYPFVENAITDYKVALADKEVDAVFVFTPNYAHYTITMDALKADKHVFCEKPITVNYKLSCAMAEEAQKRLCYPFALLQWLYGRKRKARHKIVQHPPMYYHIHTV